VPAQPPKEDAHGGLAVSNPRPHPERGYTEVVRSDAEVAGNKSGCRVAIVHLQIAGPNFHEVFMLAGDSLDAARAVLGEAVGITFHPL
jgi:hypothetical protein